jgi:subtilisin family serine protease
VPDRILLKTKAHVPEADSQALIAAHGASQTGVIGDIGVRVLHVPAANLAQVLAALASNPNVEFAEPDKITAPDFVPSDPYFGNQWHLPRIAADSAWNTTAGSASVVIAILDTGVDGAHPDLAANLVPGWNTYDNNSNSGDVYGHGTEVAGTAAASGNNLAGVSSVAFNCRIMPIRISDTAGYGYDSTAANGLTWAANHGARVANLSYQFSDSSTVSSAANYFQSKGGVVTVSSGNNGALLSLADNPNMLTVSATDGNDALASWSNTGEVVDLAAPGVSILTTTAGGGYGYVSGTSFSAPTAAGVAALVISANPGLTASQIQQVLKQSADDLGASGKDVQYGWGRVNAQRAVELAMNMSTTDSMPPSVDIGSPEDGMTVSGTVTVQVSASDNVGVTSVSLSVDGVELGTLTSAPYSFPWNTSGLVGGNHTLVATARDAAGKSAQCTRTVAVANAPDTASPTITITSPSDGARVHRNTSVIVAASDDVGVVRVELYVDNKLTATSSNPPFTTKWNAAKASSGEHQLVCRAFDAAGNVGTSPTITVVK